MQKEKTQACKKKRRVDHLLFQTDRPKKKNVLAVKQKVKLSAEGREVKKKKKFERTSFLFWASGCSGFHGERVKGGSHRGDGLKDEMFHKTAVEWSFGEDENVFFVFFFPFPKPV